MSRLIIGVDPGKMCGLAVLTPSGLFDVWTLGRVAAEDKLSALLHAAAGVAIVSVERFTINAATVRHTRQYDALEFIGVARYLCRQHGAEFRTTGASDSARVGSPVVLRHVGWWRPGPDHLRRAAAQVVLTLALTRPSEFARLVPPDMIRE